MPSQNVQFETWKAVPEDALNKEKKKKKSRVLLLSIYCNGFNKWYT